MGIARILFSTLALAAAFAAGSVAEEIGLLSPSTTKYLQLSEPLLLTAEGEQKFFHVLPAGTALYPDYSFPEGHTRYRVYVNFKGHFAAESIESDKRNLIAPIWAHTVEKEDVQQLLADTPVPKSDLVRILKAREVTKDDLAQIMREWRE